MLVIEALRIYRRDEYQGDIGGASRMAATILQLVISRHPKHQNSCLQLWHIDISALHLFNMYSLGSNWVPFIQHPSARH